MNRVKMIFDAVSANEGLARICVAAMVAELDPTLEEISDIKTAVSEAVTNSIIHGYEEKGGIIELESVIDGNKLMVIVRDFGKGIPDVAKAREPMFSTGKDKERSGMGFTFMEVFMDELEVVSTVGVGTTVTMRKKIGVNEV